MAARSGFGGGGGGLPGPGRQGPALAAPGGAPGSGGVTFWRLPPPPRHPHRRILVHEAPEPTGFRRFAWTGRAPGPFHRGVVPPAPGCRHP
ncbi:Hypothetical protein HVIM_04205 [Roseomonas mucosa]|nr:Hypothetical protein HVIM_04205 [Roseomonas mucosa]QDD98770.1 Hypothetical protein ADP8_04205 [Roseomonas mucosa]UZO90965.1 Hypothetical protein RMP42_04205 [Roseomonas mucosa]